MGDIDSMSRGNVLAQKGATQYHAQLGLPDKGSAILGLVGPAKRSGHRFLSTVPCGMTIYQSILYV